MLLTRFLFNCFNWRFSFIQSWIIPIHFEWLFCISLANFYANLQLFWPASYRFIFFFVSCRTLCSMQWETRLLYLNKSWAIRFSFPPSCASTLKVIPIYSNWLKVIPIYSNSRTSRSTYVFLSPGHIKWHTRSST